MNLKPKFKIRLNFFSLLFLILLGLKLAGLLTLSYITIFILLFIPLILSILVYIIMHIVNIIDKGL